MENLLMIDDEPFFVRKYADELKRYLKVEIVSSAEDGIKALDTKSDIDFMVLDIQMPTPVGVPPHRTKNGVNTGLWLLQERRELLLQHDFPIFVLTNRNPDDVEKQVAKLGYPRHRIEVYHKLHTNYGEFARDVYAALRGSART